MIDEIEELWKLAEECRTLAGCLRDRLVADQFTRMAEQLDEIANRLAARLPT
jgi:hypothetical protein